MRDSIRDRVYARVAEELGVALARLTPATTLSHDLGMEGDDAADFFEDFGRKFTADLQPLDGDWHCYFGPEGVGPAGMLLIAFPPLAFAYFIQRIAPMVPFWIAAIVGFAGWLGIFAYWQRSRPGRGPQISIQDLVDCAKAGKWIKQLPPEARAQRIKRAEYGGVGHWFSS